MASTRVTETILETPSSAIPNLGASKAEVQAHYDREPQLYEQFLGPNLAYSAGIWNEPAKRDTLESRNSASSTGTSICLARIAHSVCLMSGSAGAVSSSG